MATEVSEQAFWFFKWYYAPIIGELKKRWRQRRRERQKSNTFRLAKQQLCTCITSFCQEPMGSCFCTFLCRRCAITRRKCLISRFVEEGNTRHQRSLYLYTHVVLFLFSFFWKTSASARARARARQARERSERAPSATKNSFVVTCVTCCNLSSGVDRFI